MTGFPRSPRILKGGIVLLDPVTSNVRNVIPLQYNPDTLTRTLQVQGVGGEAGDRMEALRLKGPAIETIKLEAEIDATDQLEHSDANQDTVDLGIFPQLAALEGMVYAQSSRLQENNDQARMGTIEIIPAEAPLTVFVWSKNRVMPVRITEFSITEEFFDPSLNPIRAKISLGMRVLSINDVTFDSKAGSLFMAYLMNKESLALKAQGGSVNLFGITKI
jgi:hypothetical protein